MPISHARTYNPNSAQELEDTWQNLQPRLHELLGDTENGIGYEKWMALYTAVYNYCIKSHGSGGASHSTSTMLGGGLYNKLYDLLKAYLNGIRESCVTSEMSSSLLQKYDQQYRKYILSSTYINHVFQYINKFWVPREAGEGKKGVYDVYTLCLMTWKEEVFMKLQSDITSNILNIITKMRKGDQADSEVLKSVIGSYVSLGINKDEYKKTSLDVYKQYFEVDFMNATTTFYQIESAEFMSTNPTVDYVRRANWRFKQEEDLVPLCLHESSKVELMTRLEQALVSDHITVLCDQFQPLLDGDRSEDLSLLYHLLYRVKDGLGPLRDCFEVHVSKIGMSAISRIEVPEGDPNEPRDYLNTILDVHTKYAHLVKTAFNGDPGFVASLDKACRDIVNRNQRAKSAANRSPELLARFCDTVLKKSSSNPEDAELEDTLNNIMIIFKYIEDRDIFQKFYTSCLAKRLVNQTSASEDAEASMIGKLKEVCGFEYTSKLQRMFTDIGLSNDIVTEFSEKMKEEDPSGHTDFSIQILATGFWPMTPSATNFILPNELDSIYKRFLTFYGTKYEGRKLSWMFNISKGDLVTTYTKSNSYVFTAYTPGLALMLMYNHALEYTLETLLESTKVEPETAAQQLGILVKAKVLLTDNEVGAAGSIYRLNTDYRGKKLRLNFAVAIRSEVKQESEDTNKAVEEDRRLLIQAAIVRVMKARKTLKHVLLVQEVVSQLQARFKPNIPDIKKAIDVLLEKDYIKRQEDNLDVFTYVA